MFWWIDTFRLHRGDFYRWHVAGENELAASPSPRRKDRLR